MKFDKRCLRAQRSSSQSASSDRWILKKGGGLVDQTTAAERPLSNRLTQPAGSQAHNSSSRSFSLNRARAGQGRAGLLCFSGKCRDPKGEVDFAGDFDWSRLLRPCNG